MILQKQINEWSCIPTSFAMCLNISVEEIIKDFGYDGSELLDEKQHRGFHPAELIHYAYRKGYFVIPFEMKPELVNEQGKIFPIEINYNIEEIMISNKGVIVGRTKEGKMHSCAWNSSKIYDPNGTIYNLKNEDGNYNFDIDIFFLIGKMK